MPTLDVGAGRTSQDECHLSTKHVSPAHQVGPACPLARAQGRSTPVRRQVSERLRQDLLRGWRKTGTQGNGMEIRSKGEIHGSSGSSYKGIRQGEEII